MQFPVIKHLVEMKSIFLIFLFSNSLFAQVKPGGLLVPGRYTYHDNKDTIFFTPFKDLLFFSTYTIKLVDSIQVNGTGSRELLFYCSGSGRVDRHGGSFDIDENYTISRYELWDIDAKKNIFDAVFDYHCDFTRADMRLYSPARRGNESWSYRFTIDSTGTISISHLKTSVKAYITSLVTVVKNGKDGFKAERIPLNYELVPDNPEGIYRYSNGKYLRD